MDQIAHLKIFAQIVETGSFTSAATKLGLSRAVVSKAIVELERSLGARLLERTTRRVRVNEVGRAYFDRVQPILADLDEADRAVRNLQREPRGSLRISAPSSFALLHLKPVVTRYMESYPEVTLTLNLSDRLVDLIDEGYDLAIRIAQLEDSTLVARRIAPARRILCAAPSYLGNSGRPLRPGDLTSHRCLIYGDGSGRSEEWTLSGPDGDHRLRVTGPLASNSGDILCCAAVEGQGIALLPTFIVGAELQSGRLERVLPDYSPSELSIHAVYPSNRQLAIKVRAFIDIAVEHFGGRPHWDLLG